MVKNIEEIFPMLQLRKYEVTSPLDENYNCAAYAVGDNARNWWPLGEEYWPPGMPRTDTVDSFRSMLGVCFGYEHCEGGNFEPGYTKIALYTSGDRVKHLAWQLPDGQWASKLGELYDIVHKTLDGLECRDYGSASHFLKKKTDVG